MTPLFIIAVVATVVLGYEFHDELYDDDNADSLIDSQWLIGILLAVAVALLAWTIPHGWWP